MTEPRENSGAGWRAALRDSASQFGELVRTVPRWLRESGPDCAIVLSTRIRLARNLAHHAFPGVAKREHLVQVSDQVCEAVSQSRVWDRPKFLDLTRLRRLERMVLVERRLASPALANRRGPARVLLEEGEGASVMINEEDHLRLQVFQAGLNLRPAWRALQALDDELGGILDYAFTNDFGYLTACPTNTGTGMRASILIHLPALSLREEIARATRKFGARGVTIRGFYGEGSEVIGNLFQISNQLTLGRTEEQVLQLIEEVAGQLVRQERDARARLLAEQRQELEDQVWRTYGILRYARRLSSTELLNFASLLRLGLDLQLLTGWSTALLNQLMLVTQPGHLQMTHHTGGAVQNRDRVRAEVVREMLVLQ